MFDGYLIDYEVSAQAIWERVANHLLQQGMASLSNETATCAYYGRDGLKCAIGILIPENEYTPTVEGQPILNLFDRYYCPPTLYKMRQFRELMCDLQRLHDKDFLGNLRPQWYVDLINVGRQYNLDTSVIENKWKDKLALDY
jgi:hypothetical protein